MDENDFEITIARLLHFVRTLVKNCVSDSCAWESSASLTMAWNFKVSFFRCVKVSCHHVNSLEFLVFNAF